MLQNLRKKWLRSLVSGAKRVDPLAAVAALSGGRGRSPNSLALAERALRGRWNYEIADQAVDTAMFLGEPERALAICRQSAQHDTTRTFACTASYLEELLAARDEPAADDRLCLFGDTDDRINIGCRLTSKTFKRLLAERIGVVPVGIPYLFGARERAAEDMPRLSHDERSLRDAVARNFGDEAVARIERAEIVVFQPEGTLSSRAGLEEVEGFFSPVLLAQGLGRTVVLMNGTVPNYDGERGAFVLRVLAACDRHAMRDALSAKAWGSTFIPDAAFAFEPPAVPGRPDGVLITTGARKNWRENHRYAEAGLAVCRRHGLRPVMLTKNLRHLLGFRAQVAEMGGIFAETASLAEASRIVRGCRLHVGGRYHSAILAADCGVPSALFAVDTGKNAWLADFVDGIEIVADERDVDVVAARVFGTDLRPMGDRGVSAGMTKFLRGLSLSS